MELPAVATAGAFQQLGKPKGAAHWLLRLSIQQTMEDPQSSAPDILDSRLYPLFGRLTLSHRLALMAELAEGLLCPGAPLPPDTLQHHAALLYLFEHVQDRVNFELEALQDFDEEEEEAQLGASRGGGLKQDGGPWGEELGPLGEDDGAELAAEVQRAADAVAAAEETAAEAAPAAATAAAAAAEASGSGAQQQPQPAQQQQQQQEEQHVYEPEDYRRRLTRSMAVRQRQGTHARRQAQRVAAELAGLTDGELLEEMAKGTPQSRLTPQGLLVTCSHITRLGLQGQRQIPLTVSEVLADSNSGQVMHERLNNAEDLRFPEGRVTWRQLFCRYIKQRYPQLNPDPQLLQSDTCEVFTHARYRMGPCLLLSEAELALQYGTYDDTTCEREKVARTLLVNRFVQQATEEFAHTWTPDQDLRHWRLLHVACPPAGWFTFPYLTTDRLPDMKESARLIEKTRRLYFEWAHSAGENLEAWRKEGKQLRLYLDQIEGDRWILDWHRAVRQLPGSYASLAARLQAVKAVSTRWVG